MPRHHYFIALLVVLSGSPLLAMSPRASAEIVGQYRQSLVYGPQPDYPAEARARHLIGSGMFLIRVPVKTGRVIEVRVVQSTGQALLDAAAVAALKQWRFKPGAIPPIGAISPWRHDPFGKTDALLKVPISFVM
jgi:TonB family protein